MKLYFASSNEHKKMEMSRLLGGYKLVIPKEEGIAFDPDETGSSLVENAIIKAKALYSIVQRPVIADDSGLFVDALGGKPGVHTARYGEENGRKLTDKEKYTLLLSNLEGIKDRKAHFSCAICLMLSESRMYIIEESMEGKIAEQASGNHGFGYDPVFFSDEAGEVIADLDEGKKDMYSHRGKSARLIRMLLDREMEDGKE